MAHQAKNKKAVALAFILIGIVTATVYLPFLGVSQPTLGNTALLAKMDMENGNYESAFHLLFGSVALDASNYSFSPPISMYKALIIGLQNDNWTANDLKNQTIHVHFQHYIFFSNVTGIELCSFMEKENLISTSDWGLNPSSNMRAYGSEPIKDVTAPTNDYQPQTFDRIVLRYLWIFSITENGRIPGVPVPTYLIDAATGESIWPGPLG
jgi:hypothetical protein